MPIALFFILAFATVFACLEAWKGSTAIKPANFGWLAVALFLLSQVLFHGQQAFFK